MSRRRSKRVLMRAVRVWGAGLAVLAFGVAGCSNNSGGHPSSSSTPTVGAASQPSAASPAISTGSARSASTGRTSPKAGSHPSTVASQAVTTLPAVPIRRPANFGTGLSVQMTSVAHGVSNAAGRGALSGRATVSLTLVLRNSSQRSIPVDTVQVTATYGATKTPAVPSYGAGTKNFTGSLSGGQSATAVYRFLIPSDAQYHVDVTVWYRPGAPAVLLRGSVR